MRKFHHEVPGPFGIIVQILSGAIVGLLIAGVYLTLKPVKLADGAPAADKSGEATLERNVVTYVPGHPGHPQGQQWRQRERAFLEKAQGGVALGEQDVNRWLATTYGSADRRFKLESYDFEMEPSVPLCRVSGSEFQVGIEYQCKLGPTKKLIVAQARGRFEKDGDRQVFVPTTVYLGSCPLPGKLGSMLVDKLSATYPVPENVTASWKAVTSAKVEENQLKLAFN